jgi:DNA-directed RNA polymerase subunit M/transcription elongation factor TFIIS
MEFCKNCDNMYYMKKNGKKLVHFCKNCNYEDSQLINMKGLKVFEYSTNNDDSNVRINEYTRYDPTLPHLNTIKCPNMECKSNKNDDVQQDVIYIRVDEKNMKYNYLCYHCNFNWKP